MRIVIHISSQIKFTHKMASQNQDPAAVNTVKDLNNQTKLSNEKPSLRLKRELMTLMTCGDAGISAFPDGDNLFRWKGTIEGAQGTVYEGLKYKMIFEFPSGYPYQPPTVKFDSPCYHPNVDSHGNICLDILKEQWSALYDVRTVLLSVQSLLGEPNIDSPLNIHAADLWQNQVLYKSHLLEKYEKEVRSKQLT